MESKDNEYRIYIHNVVEQDKKTTPEEQATSFPTPEKAKEVANKGEKSTAMLIAQQIGKESFNYALNNYGDLTGDYETQSMIQIGLGIASDISSIAIATASGGYVGLALSLSGIGIKYASQGIGYGINIAKERQRNAILRERLGNAAIGGDRR